MSRLNSVRLFTLPAVAIHALALIWYLTLNYSILSGQIEDGFHIPSWHFGRLAIVVSLQILTLAALLNGGPRFWWLALLALVFQLDVAVTQLSLLYEMSSFYVSRLDETFSWIAWFGNMQYFVLQALAPCVVALTLPRAGFSARHVERASAV